MNYLYIICLALSSLFTYKPLSAETHPLQYAFFIPGGAFQQNTRVQDIRLMKPRYAKPDEESESSAAVSFSKRRSTADFSSNSVSSSDSIPSSATAKTFAESPSVTSSSTLSTPKASEPQYTLPVVEKKLLPSKKSPPILLQKPICQTHLRQKTKPLRIPGFPLPTAPKLHLNCKNLNLMKI